MNVPGSRRRSCGVASGAGATCAAALGQLVGVVDARGAGPGGPLARVEPVPGGRQPLRQRGRHRQLLVHLRADRLERRPRSSVRARSLRPRRRMPSGRVAGGQVDRGAGGAAQLRERFVEALGAELVPGAVAALALHAVAPALVRAVDDRRGLPGIEGERAALRRDHLLSS